MSDHQKESELEHVWSVISHELATPLFVIQSNLRRLDEKFMPLLLDISQKVKEADISASPTVDKLLKNYQAILPEIQSITHRMRQLHSRWNRKLLPEKFHPSKEPVNIKACVEASIQDYQPIYDLEDKSRIHVDLNEAMVLGDETIIKHIFYELFSNAEYADKADPDNKNAIIVSISSNIDEQGYHLQVKSTGAAIDAANLPKLFDAYFSTKTSYIGLGLTFCQRAMQHMQGDISCRTENDGKTAIFTLSFTVISK